MNVARGEQVLPFQSPARFQFPARPGPALIACLALACLWLTGCLQPASAQPGPQAAGQTKELFSTAGPISAARSGWTYEAAGGGGGTVFLPFAGRYPNKSGRLQSPFFSLDRTADRPGYYVLTFKAKSTASGYWWLDYRDEYGEALPDCNSAIYPSAEFSDYQQVIYVSGRVREVQIAFVSTGQVEVDDVRFAETTAAAAAAWCDAVEHNLPPLAFQAPADAMQKLPKTAAALRSGKPWRVLMLGDSIVNDSFNSVFQSLLQRDFPDSRFTFVLSVLGSTGCPRYRKPEEFKKYVVDQKPDLLMIGGISNFADFTTEESAALADVVRMAREQINCEVLVMSQPLSRDWRADRPAGGWRALAADPGWRRNLDASRARDIARTLDVPFWDMTTPCQDYLATAGDFSFNRDFVHNDDCGKQVIGRVMMAHFLTAP